MIGLLNTSAAVQDSTLRQLDRPGIWDLLWKMRYHGAGDRSVHAVLKRWEKLTGRRYYG